MQTLKAAATYFALVFGAGFVLGAIRVPLLVPRLGERAAELAEMPLMLAVIWLSARFIVRRFALPPRAAARLGAGFVALGLLIAAEAALVVALRGQTPGEYLAGRDPVAGAAYYAMLLVYAFMPLAVERGGDRGARALRRP